MAWKQDFLTKNLNWWKRKIDNARFYNATSSQWTDTDIISKEIDGNVIMFQILVEGTEPASITKVQLIDTDGDVAFEGTQTVTKQSAQGTIIQIDVTITEE